MKTRKVKPYGMLYSQGREYFALQPVPIPSEDWNWEDNHENVFRFVVVPRSIIDETLELQPIYTHARHIVTNSFTLEYADMPEINIREIELDLSREDIDYAREEDPYSGS